MKDTKNKFSINKLLVIIVFLIIVGGLLLSYVYQRRTIPPVIKMRMYQDTKNHFTISIPENWQITNSTSEGSTKIDTDHPITQKIETTQMFLPNEIGITVQSYEGTPSCPLDPQPTTTLAGFPATYDDLQHIWTLYTADATITVEFAYPQDFHDSQLNPPTAPAPQYTYNEETKLLNEVIKTLRFTNLQPFTCK